MLCPRVLIIRVAASCYLGRLSLLFVRGLMTMAGFSSANSLTVARYFVLLVYAPNRNPEREEFYDDVCVRVDPSVPTVLCGDFNAAFDRLVDRVGSDPADTVRESLVALAHLFSSCCVTDIWRYLHPSTNSFTWSRWNGLVASHIDLIGCPYAWISSVGCCDILPFPFSDHCALFFSVSVPDAISPGPGLWKLNSAVLDEPEFVAHFKLLVLLA